MVKVIFRCIQLSGITGFRCSDGFMLVLTEIKQQFCLFSRNCLCRSPENKAKWIIEQDFSVFTQRLGDDMPIDNATGEVPSIFSPLLKIASKLKYSIWMVVSHDNLFTLR